MGEERVPGVDTICDGMREAVFVVGPDRRVTYANARLLEASGQDRDALVGEPVDVLAAVTLEGFEAFEDALAALESADPGTERRVEGIVEPPGQGRLVVELRLTVIESGDVLVVMRDVSERAAYEAALERKTDQLAVLNRLLRHDIRNDANVVAGWSDKLLDALEDPDLRAAAENVRAAAGHIVDLTSQSADVQAVISEVGEMDRSPVALDRVLRQEVEKAREMHPEATVELTPAPPSVAVPANELLGSVFGNLLNNAVVHNDGPEPHVAVRVEREGDDVVVAVADDGPGVAPERRATLFDRDERGLESSGSGMGLFIVDTLVGQFGGEVTVDDADLGGAVFRVRLPVVEDP